MKRSMKRKAFTIIEMTIVIAVIAILATVMIPTIGGMIEKAYVSTDTQFAASLNIQLALWEVDYGDIENESDLRDAINSVYGDDYYETEFTPKSGKYGYHYWYEIASGTVVLKSVSDFAATPAPTAETEEFSPNSLRSGLVDGYYLMGSDGNEFGDIINALEVAEDPQYYEDALNDLYALSVNTDSEYSTLAGKLLTKLETITVITNFGAARSDIINNITAVYIPLTVKTIDVQNVYQFSFTSEPTEDGVYYTLGIPYSPADAPLATTLVDAIELHSDVVIAFNGLPAIQHTPANGTYEGTTKLFVNASTIDELKKMVADFATNCVIVLPDESRYIVEGSNIFPLPRQVDNAGAFKDAEGNYYTPPVASTEGRTDYGDYSINITCPDAPANAGSSDIYMDGDTLYIAYDRTESVSLGVENAFGTVVWTVTNYDTELVDEPAISVDGGSIVMPATLIEFGVNNMFTATAKIANTDIEDSITVHLVRPTELSFKIDGTAYNSTSELLKEETERWKINLTYVGPAKRTFAIEELAVACANMVKIEGATVADLAFTTSGNNLFTVSGTTLTLNAQDSYAGEQTLTVTLGNHMSFEFTVTVTDISASPFVLNTVQGKPIGEDFLFRVGNANTFTLGNLFNAIETNKKLSGAVTVDIYNLTASADVKPLIATNSVQTVTTGSGLDATITAGDTWDATTIRFSGTGVAKIELSDVNGNATPILVEVVNGKNVTTATSATSSNIVLLNDVTVQDNSNDFATVIQVYNDYTIYGNGFTVNLPTDHLSSGAGFTGYIKLGNNNGTGGNLDNVRIVGPVYPEANLFSSDALVSGSTYNYFYNSVMIVNGNCTISNSYISGSRTALYTYGGNNIVIENTTLSGGVFANMQISGGLSVTFRNVTTVQTPVTDSYGQGEEVMGVGIFVGNNTTDISIEGTLDQYNWATKDQLNANVPSEYRSVFTTFFDYSTTTYNETEVINCTMMFLDSYNEDNLSDSTANGYVPKEEKVGTYEAVLYSKFNCGALESIDAPDYVTEGFNPVAPTFNFTLSNDDQDADDPADASDTYCEYDNVLNIGVTGDSKTIDLSGVTVSKNGKTLEITKYLGTQEITGNSVEIKVSDGTTQKLTFIAVSDAGYNTDGTANSGEVTYTWTVTVNIAKLSYAPPAWNMGDTYKFEGTSNLVYTYHKNNFKIRGYAEAVPIFNGIKVTYYNNNGTLTNMDFSSITTAPTVSADNALKYVYTLSDGSVLTLTLDHTSWKGNPTAFFFTTYNSKLYIYPQGVNNDNYVRAAVGNQNFDVEITYNFTDPHGRSTGDQVVQWYNAKASNSSITTEHWDDFDSVNTKGDSTSCVTPDTLVTLADGTRKEIQYVTYEDELLVWNFYTGEYDVVPASYLINHGYGNYNILSLNFADGTTVKVINKHGFYDADSNEFVFVTEDNIDDYVGHFFAKQDGSTTKLVGYTVTEEYTESYSVLSYGYYNCYLEGMLSLTPPEIGGNLFMPFEIVEDMTYDAEQMQADIEIYGLYTYEEFADVMSEELFEALNMKYIKVAVGKGIITYDEVMALLELHFGS